MRKLIFTAFSVFVFILFIGIFTVQKKLSDTYYYEKKFQSIMGNCKKIEEKYNKLKEKNESIHISADFGKYMADSGNAVAFIDNKGEIMFSTFVYGKYLENIDLEKYYQNRIKKHLKEIMAITSGKYVIEKNDYLNQNHLLCVYPFKSGEKLLIFSSVNEIKQAINIVNELLFKVLGVGIIVALCIINLISNRINKYLLKLTEQAEKIIKMNFDEQVEIEGPKEIRMLGKTMNFLSSALGDNITKLNKANQKLKEDINLKEEQEEIRKQFISDVSHELKTPVTIIKSYSEALIDGIGDREYYIQGINDETNIMEKMVGELLELSRLESDTIMFDFEIINLGDLIEINLKKFDNIIEKYDRSIRFKYSKDIVEIEGDRNKLEQVIKNLIMNAVIHSTKEVIEVSLNVESNKAKFSVYNKCKEISEEEMEQLWNRFYKVDKSRKREKRGSGLGLAIVKNIVEKHNGEYGVNYINEGLEFWIEFGVQT
ncbi:sensor histidine kinase [Clostridium ganghwense]|uniref:histidine kinase n=1 Tax=Clostridium ganghwense TaxID=312089 RepID=A0ABT4CJ24_9CLOT|nr:HAMP domain-containing sensor histidine kinase [Clostridium ganghwense]MCY6369054.1 HAMP domain-containing sensor histidine kinase [Clostridium ganghwense]